MLSEYFSSPLPEPKVFADMITNRAFEVESVERDGNDTIYDIKVLPDRAHDAYAHQGMAAEIARLFSFPLKDIPAPSIKIDKDILAPSVLVENKDLCVRYIAERIDGVKIGDSPRWMQERLISLGARPINNIVDAANYAMYETGQPLHAFDALKIEGAIVVRLARAGESMETLDGKKIELSPDTLIIADEAGPLAIAGVKGGKRAEIDFSTHSLIIESATFNSVSVRKSARRFDLLTDAARRFENGLAPEVAARGIDRMIELLVREDTTKTLRVGARTDIYPAPLAAFRIGITKKNTEEILGYSFSESDFQELLSRISPDVVSISDPRAAIVSSARSLLGAEYIPVGSVRGDAPARFSCSSFTNYLYVYAGLALPSISIDQYAYGTHISENDLLPGDLIFSNTKEGTIRDKTISWMEGTVIPEGVDHVGVWMGDGKVIHATRTHGKVVEEILSESAQFKNIVGFRRYTGVDESRFVVTIPPERLDLRITEDLVEEIARMIGYDRIAPVLPEPPKHSPEPEKKWWYTYRVRKALTELGFSEIMTSSFRPEGDIQIMNPLAEDKRFLRRDLSKNMREALAKNVLNADIFGCDTVRMFELGSVFTVKKEYFRLVIGAAVFRGPKNAAKDAVAEALNKLREVKGSNLPPNIQLHDDETIAELLDFKDYYEDAPEPTVWDDVLPEHVEAAYQPFSLYPFASRDIALWVPEGTSAEEISSLIKEHAGGLLARPIRLFDMFSKDGKVSYAFRMVFQSNEKTLNEHDITPLMKNIGDALTARGWTIR